MGGLNAATNGGQSVDAPTPTGPEYAPPETGPSASNGNAGESHLDSLFRGSSWTREDVSLLLDVASVLILLYWAHTEVA